MGHPAEPTTLTELVSRRADAARASPIEDAHVLCDNVVRNLPQGGGGVCVCVLCCVCVWFFFFFFCTRAMSWSAQNQPAELPENAGTCRCAPGGRVPARNRERARRRAAHLDVLEHTGHAPCRRGAATVARRPVSLARNGRGPVAGRRPVELDRRDLGKGGVRPRRASVQLSKHRRRRPDPVVSTQVPIAAWHLQPAGAGWGGICRVDASGDGHIAEEYAVLDRVGRLQLPERFTSALALRKRVRLGSSRTTSGSGPTAGAPGPRRARTREGTDDDA